MNARSGDRIQPRENTMQGPGPFAFPSQEALA
jgi:hypothetical protein